MLEVTAVRRQPGGIGSGRAEGKLLAIRRAAEILRRG
jgi:hypothetical protein